MKKISILAGLCLTAWLSVNNPVVSPYVDSLKAASISVARPSDPLYQQIIKHASTYKIPPSDAKIDRVWKAIPGYNGLKADIKASYQKMKQTGKFDEKKLVFTQTKPKVHLSDLPPAPIYRGNPDKPMVSFIINVAWGNEYLPDMLATLKKHHVTASFFLEGNWTKKNPKLAKIIASSGNEIGNHSYSHPDMKIITSDRAKAELVKTNDVIEAATGVKCTLFAPPSGSYRDETVKIASQLKMRTVMWTLDTIDWQKPSPDTIINRIVPRVGNGSIILMHPTASTAQALDRLITQIEQKHLKIGTVSELMSEERLIN